MQIQTADNKLQSCLLALRLTVFLVMFMWTLDKFVNPSHAAGVFANFYSIEGLESNMFMIIGVVEMALIIAFVLGLYKKITYGLVLLLHAVSTLSSWRLYLGFDNLLFFAAWPMLAACWTLFQLRDADTMWTLNIDKKESQTAAAG